MTGVGHTSLSSASIRSGEIIMPTIFPRGVFLYTHAVPAARTQGRSGPPNFNLNSSA